MNLFGGKTSIKRRPANVRVVSAPVVIKTPAPLPKNLVVERGAGSARSSPSGRSRTATPNLESDSRGLKPPSNKRSKTARRASPNAWHQPKFDEDDGESSDEDDSLKKRRRTEGVSGSVDLKRRLRSRRAFSTDEDGGKFTMIHAADTTAVPRKTSKISESATIEDITVKLRYPSASQRERYAASFSLTFGCQG